MSEYAVLLESYAQLPISDWGTELSDRMVRHVQDVNRRLRRQQGIVWESLEPDKARILAGFLIEKGYPAGIVKQDDIYRLGKVRGCVNADIVRHGIEFRGYYGDTVLWASDSICFAQAGYIEQQIEDAGSLRKIKFSLPDTRTSYTLARREASKRKPRIREKIGWVLYLFQKEEESDWLKIESRRFNYSYQRTLEGSRDERFGWLLRDLSTVLPPEVLDPGFRSSIGSGLKPPKEARYENEKSMRERARWALTIRSLELN